MKLYTTILNNTDAYVSGDIMDFCNKNIILPSTAFCLMFEIYKNNDIFIFFIRKLQHEWSHKITVKQQIEFIENLICKCDDLNERIVKLMLYKFMEIYHFAWALYKLNKLQTEIIVQFSMCIPLVCDKYITHSDLDKIITYEIGELHAQLYIKNNNKIYIYDPDIVTQNEKQSVRKYDKFIIMNYIKTRTFQKEGDENCVEHCMEFKKNYLKNKHKKQLKLDIY